MYYYPVNNGIFTYQLVQDFSASRIFSPQPWGEVEKTTPKNEQQKNKKNNKQI